ncbi:hypothetical protein D8B26_002530 [Coccidioides posadasii str. Silveira]|uniref:uncharacterized protein n=1 Tax=Coccidioides posadasii (strain RMSCC 757 / Silveira) TaxID=443226 RepID=UPI001BED541A|nr:hypothetical protein D8B26_002530 [Coccidioides posadasii str. Silveira]
MARSLSPHQLQIVVLGLAQKLDSLNVDYASMGGAAGCLLTQRPDRETEDVDLVIHVDHRMITADRLISQLLASFPSEFGPNWKYLTIKVGRSGPSTISNLPPEQQGLSTGIRSRLSAPNGTLSQYQRQGSVKEGTDIRDVTLLAPLCSPGKAELDFNNSKVLQNALSNLV